MLELAATLLPVLRGGDSVAVVTVVGVSRSAPRGVGTAMALTRGGDVIGSISGGCVEGDAILLATEVLATGRARTARLGFSDDAAHAAGLACGGSVDVVVHRLDSTDAVAIAAFEAAAADRSTVVGLVCSGPALGSVLPLSGTPDDSRMLETAYDDADVLALAHRPRPTLVIIGAGDHAMALARVAGSAGFAVTVCDVWERLVTVQRFPTADRLITGLPGDELGRLIDADPARSAVCVLTHDERVDIPAIAAALRVGVGFVGAMGARSTVAHRARLLRESGVTESDIARLHSPLGLDLGGESPAETAVAVLAEIIAARHGAPASPLRDGTGPLHRLNSSRRTPTTADTVCIPHLQDVPR